MAGHSQTAPSLKSTFGAAVNRLIAEQKKERKRKNPIPSGRKMEDLCFGDTIALYSEDCSGYVYAAQSSEVRNQIAIAVDQDRDKPKLQAVHSVQFEMKVQDRYKATKRFNKLHPSDEHYEQAQLASLTEHRNNKEEQIRQAGKSVSYGQIVQIRHVFTQKYVNVNTNQTSITEASNLSTELLRVFSKSAQFKILPRYKVKAEGDTVQIGDLVQFESLKTPGQFLNCSAGVYKESEVYHNSRELNLSGKNSGFTIVRCAKCDNSNSTKQLVKSGMTVQIFHKQIEAFLAAEGLFLYGSDKGKIDENAHLRVRKVEEDDSRTMAWPTSGIVCWTIDKVLSDHPFSGSPIAFLDEIRLQHATTLHYLCVDDEGRVGLTPDRYDPYNVFQVVAVAMKSEHLIDKSYMRLRHVATKTWLHASDRDYKRQYKKEKSKNSAIKANDVVWSKCELKQITTTDDIQYQDAFIVKITPIKLAKDLRYACGMVPFLQKLLTEFHQADEFSSRRMQSVKSAMDELHDCLLENHRAMKSRQKLLRNFKIVDLLVDILKCPSGEAKSKEFVNSIHAQCYRILTKYLEGSSRKNELYLTKHFEFFQEQLSFTGKVGLSAADMLVELLKDNREIINLVDKEEMLMFIELLKYNRNSRYLDLLSVLCVANDVPIRENQNFIAEQLLDKQLNSGILTFFEFGQELGLTKGVVYISTDKNGPWEPIEDLINLRAKFTMEEYLYVERQLNLYSALTKGRNRKSNRFICEEGRLLDFDRSFACLRMQYKLPHGDGFRAVIAENIIHLYVDVGDNHAVMDRVARVFDYETVVNPGEANLARSKSKFSSVEPLMFVEELQDWISTFLDENVSSIASIEFEPHNCLIARVLSLVRTLVNFGYYGDTDRVGRLVKPILSLVNGRNDVPRLFTSKSLSSAEQREIDEYRATDRFRSESTALSEAKSEGLKVLELYFNFRFNTQMQRFVAEFKEVRLHERTHPLAPFLQSENDEIFRTQDQYRQVAAREIDNMHDQKESTEFRKEFIQTLQDLMYYRETTVVTQALMLLVKYFSATETLFKNCVQTQLLISPRSRSNYEKLRAALPQFFQYSRAEQTEKTIDKLSAILDDFMAFCCIDSSLQEPHPLNQRMLYNCGVLAAVFDLIRPYSQEPQTLSDRSKSDKGLHLLRQCLRFLKLFARDNDTVKTHLFDILQTILHAKGAETELAAVLMEIFTDNLQLCLRIRPQSIRYIACLYDQDQHPIWLLLLCRLAITGSFPIKRNQNYIIRALMSCKKAMSIITDTRQSERANIMDKARDDPDSKSDKYKTDAHQLCSLLSVFATCAIGENKAIESIAQCLLTMDELINLSLSDLCAGYRQSFLMLLTHTYLHSHTDAAHNEMRRFGSDGRMYKLLKVLLHDIEKASDVASGDQELVMEHLRQRPLTVHRSQADKLHEQKELLHYTFDGVLPFLRAIFASHWDQTVPKEKAGDLAKRLFKAVHEFATITDPILSNVYQRRELRSTLDRISEVTGYLIKKDLQKSFNRTGIVETSALRDYHKTYAEEIKLNSQFDEFANQLLAAYEGKNSIKHQLGFGDDSPYFEDPTNPMPLGEQFQQLIACFRAEHRHRTKRMSVPTCELQDGMQKGTPYVIRGLVRHLLGSNNKQNGSVDEATRLALAATDQKALQILRAIIHNEYAVSVRTAKKFGGELLSMAMKSVQHVQKSMDSQGLAMAVLPHLARRNDNLVRECFNVLYQLYRSNTDTPGNFVRDVNKLQEEAFFTAVQYRLQHSASLIKERRYLMRQYESTRARVLPPSQPHQQAMSALKHKLTSARNGAINTARTSARSRNDKVSPEDLEMHGLQSAGLAGMGTHLGVQRSRGRPSIVDEYDNMPLIAPSDKRPSTAMFSTTSSQDNRVSTGSHLRNESQLKQSFDNEFSVMTVIMKTTQALCDLEFTNAQDLIRDQPKNVKSINLVTEMCQFLSLLYTNVEDDMITLLAEVMETLIEVVQGNRANQLVLFDLKVIDYLNHLMQTFEDYADDKSIRQVLRLQAGIATLIRFLTEENQEHTNRVFQSKTIMSAVNKDALVKMASVMYHIAEPYKKKKHRGKDDNGNYDKYPNQTERDAARMRPGISDEDREEAINIGFVFFHLLHRAEDLGSEGFDVDDYVALHEPFKDIAAYYATETKSVEILKGSILQRLYFRSESESVLRPAVQDRLKWEVDRSSQGNKVRDFMMWITDIHEDINFQRLVNRNVFGRFFVRNWKPFNMLLLIITAVINICMLAVWDFEHRQSYWIYQPHKLNLVWHVAGAVHNLCAVALVLSYFLSNSAGFVSSYRTYSLKLKQIQRRFQTGKKKEKPYRPSKLEVNILGGRTLYYMIFLVFSFMGSIISPAFFAVHLLQIVENNNLLTRVILAVTVNGLSLAWVALLGCIIIYIYGLAGFISLRGVFQGNLHFCDNLLQCTASMFREGLMYRAMRIDYPVKVDPDVVTLETSDFSLYTAKLIFDLSFFVIVLTIGLNVIFGIIVDTFRQLRDQKWRIENDIETKCFICGRNSYEFDQKFYNGFKIHRLEDHNIHAYVLFFVRLNDMPVEDMSHLEKYIKDLAGKDIYSFIPLNRALALNDDEDSSVQHELVIMEQLHQLTDLVEQNNASVVNEIQHFRTLGLTQPSAASSSGRDRRGGFQPRSRSKKNH